MSDPAGFLNAFAHALAVMTLYPDGHPARERAVDAAFEELDGLSTTGKHPAFTFLEHEVVYGNQPLRELKAWDWGPRLVAAGVQRLEFERRVSRDEFNGFLDEILARLTLSAIDTSENRQVRSIGIRFGAVGLQGQTESDAPTPALATLDVTLGEEAETLRWLQQQVRSEGTVPLLEAEAVVRSLSVAMHGDRRIMLPLLQLKEFDEYTTTHSLNVAVLSMGLAEYLQCGPRQSARAAVVHRPSPTSRSAPVSNSTPTWSPPSSRCCTRAKRKYGCSTKSRRFDRPPPGSDQRQARDSCGR